MCGVASIVATQATSKLRCHCKPAALTITDLGCPLPGQLSLNGKKQAEVGDERWAREEISSRRYSQDAV